MGQRDTRRERLVARVLVAVGAFGVLVMLAGIASTGWMWHEIREGLRLRRPGAKVVHVAGCDSAYLDEAVAPDGGSARVPHYTLVCLDRDRTATMPTCDDVIARYVAAHGPLPADVRVLIRRDSKAPLKPCEHAYAGDGTPK